MNTQKKPVVEMGQIPQREAEKDTHFGRVEKDTTRDRGNSKCPGLRVPAVVDGMLVMCSFLSLGLLSRSLIFLGVS